MSSTPGTSSERYDNTNSATNNSVAPDNNPVENDPSNQLTNHLPDQKISTVSSKFTVKPVKSKYARLDSDVLHISSDDASRAEAQFLTEVVHGEVAFETWEALKDELDKKRSVIRDTLGKNACQTLTYFCNGLKSCWGILFPNSRESSAPPYTKILEALEKGITGGASDENAKYIRSRAIEALNKISREIDLVRKGKLKNKAYLAACKSLLQAMVAEGAGGDFRWPDQLIGFDNDTGLGSGYAVLDYWSQTWGEVAGALELTEGGKNQLFIDSSELPKVHEPLESLNKAYAGDPSCYGVRPGIYRWWVKKPIGFAEVSKTLEQDLGDIAGKLVECAELSNQLHIRERASRLYKARQLQAECYHKAGSNLTDSLDSATKISRCSEFFDATPTQVKEPPTANAYHFSIEMQNQLFKVINFDPKNGDEWLDPAANEEFEKVKEIAKNIRSSVWRWLGNQTTYDAALKLWDKLEREGPDKELSDLRAYCIDTMFDHLMFNPDLITGYHAENGVLIGLGQVNQSEQLTAIARQVQERYLEDQDNSEALPINPSLTDRFDKIKDELTKDSDLAKKVFKNFINTVKSAYGSEEKNPQIDFFRYCSALNRSRLSRFIQDKKDRGFKYSVDSDLKVIEESLAVLQVAHMNYMGKTWSRLSRQYEIYADAVRKLEATNRGVIKKLNSSRDDQLAHYSLESLSELYSHFSESVIEIADLKKFVGDCEAAKQKRRADLRLPPAYQEIYESLDGWMLKHHERHLEIKGEESYDRFLDLAHKIRSGLVDTLPTCNVVKPISDNAINVIYDYLFDPEVNPHYNNFCSVKNLPAASVEAYLAYLEELGFFGEVNREFIDQVSEDLTPIVEARIEKLKGSSGHDSQTKRPMYHALMRYLDDNDGWNQIISRPDRLKDSANESMDPGSEAIYSSMVVRAKAYLERNPIQVSAENSDVESESEENLPHSTDPFGSEQKLAQKLRKHLARQILTPSEVEFAFKKYIKNKFANLNLTALAQLASESSTTQDGGSAGNWGNFLVDLNRRVKIKRNLTYHEKLIGNFSPPEGRSSWEVYFHEQFSKMVPKDAEFAGFVENKGAKWHGIKIDRDKASTVLGKFLGSEFFPENSDELLTRLESHVTKSQLEAFLKPYANSLVRLHKNQNPEAENLVGTLEGNCIGSKKNMRLLDFLKGDCHQYIYKCLEKFAASMEYSVFQRCFHHGGDRREQGGSGSVTVSLEPISLLFGIQAGASVDRITRMSDTYAHLFHTITGRQAGVEGLLGFVNFLMGTVYEIIRGMSKLDRKNPESSGLAQVDSYPKLNRLANLFAPDVFTKDRLDLVNPGANSNLNIAGFGKKHRGCATEQAAHYQALKKELYDAGVLEKFLAYIQRSSDEFYLNFKYNSWSTKLSFNPFKSLKLSGDYTGIRSRDESQVLMKDRWSEIDQGFFGGFPLDSEDFVRSAGTLPATRAILKLKGRESEAGYAEIQGEVYDYHKGLVFYGEMRRWMKLLDVRYKSDNESTLTDQERKDFSGVLNRAPRHLQLVAISPVIGNMQKKLDETDGASARIKIKDIRKCYEVGSFKEDLRKAEKIFINDNFDSVKAAYKSNGERFEEYSKLISDIRVLLYEKDRVENDKDKSLIHYYGKPEDIEASIRKKVERSQEIAKDYCPVISKPTEIMGPHKLRGRQSHAIDNQAVQVMAAMWREQALISGWLKRLMFESVHDTENTGVENINPQLPERFRESIGHVLNSMRLRQESFEAPTVMLNLKEAIEHYNSNLVRPLKYDDNIWTLNLNLQLLLKELGSPESLSAQGGVGAGIKLAFKRSTEAGSDIGCYETVYNKVFLDMSLGFVMQVMGLAGKEGAQGFAVNLNMAITKIADKIKNGIKDKKVRDQDFKSQIYDNLTDLGVIKLSDNGDYKENSPAVEKLKDIWDEAKKRYSDKCRLQSEVLLRFWNREYQMSSQGVKSVFKEQDGKKGYFEGLPIFDPSSGEWRLPTNSEEEYLRSKVMHKDFSRIQVGFGNTVGIGGQLIEAGASLSAYNREFRTIFYRPGTDSDLHVRRFLHVGVAIALQANNCHYFMDALQQACCEIDFDNVKAMLFSDSFDPDPYVGVLGYRHPFAEIFIKQWEKRQKGEGDQFIRALMINVLSYDQQSMDEGFRQAYIKWKEVADELKDHHQAFEAAQSRFYLALQAIFNKHLPTDLRDKPTEYLSQSIEKKLKYMFEKHGFHISKMAEFEELLTALEKYSRDYSKYIVFNDIFLRFGLHGPHIRTSENGEPYVEDHHGYRLNDDKESLQGESSLRPGPIGQFDTHDIKVPIRSDALKDFLNRGDEACLAGYWRWLLEEQMRDQNSKNDYWREPGKYCWLPHHLIDSRYTENLGLV